MKRSLAAILILVLMGLAPSDKSDQLTPATQSVRFTYVDVRIDPHDKPLAAYQIEFVAGDPQRVKLVGVEGGSHPAFVDPPYYDPAALSHNRVILAAFNTGSALPKQSFRAATLHLEVIGDAGETPKWSAKLIVASDSDGNSMPADVSVTRQTEGESR